MRESDAGYEQFEVEADVGIRAWGPTRAEAFAQAALGVLALVADPATVTAREAREVRAQADGPETLLAAWIDECLYVHEIEAFVVSRGEVPACSDTVVHGIGARGDLDAAHHERLDLVHVEALVDPRGEERLRTVGLGAHLARLARGDRRRIGDQGEHAERRLSERLGARRTPGPDPDVGLDLELLVARIEFTHGGFGGPFRGPPSLLRACNSASRVCGGLGGHVGAPHLF